MEISKKQLRPHDVSNRHDKAVICFEYPRLGPAWLTDRPRVWLAALENVKTKKTIRYGYKQKPTGVPMRTPLF
jgi:hypothetical protein